MNRKTNIYRVIVRQDNGRLVSYDESAASATVVVRNAPFELVQVQQIDAETGDVLRVVYPARTLWAQSQYPRRSMTTRRSRTASH
jgi:hypothetical protein